MEKVLTYLRRDHRNFIIQLAILINCNPSLAVTKSMPVKLFSLVRNSVLLKFDLGIPC